MRAVVTGQIGVDKKPYLTKSVELSAERGEPIDLFHLGDMMYGEASDVRRLAASCAAMRGQGGGIGEDDERGGDGVEGCSSGGCCC